MWRILRFLIEALLCPPLCVRFEVGHSRGSSRSPFLREGFLRLLQFSHLVKGRLKFQLDLEQRTNTSHVFTLLGVSWVKSSVTVTCKTDAFYIVCSLVYVQVGVVAHFGHVHQMFQASSIMDILLDMSAVQETTKSKIITKFTGLRNVDLPSNSLFVSVCSVKNTSC